jgi:LPXTG-motif cell wall-anchored protein
MLCGTALALVLGASCARADEWDKLTVLTVNQPLQVTDKLLDPGTYVLKLLGGHSDRYTDRNTVEIFNADQTRVIDTIVAIPTYRVQTASKSEFTFWETPPGTARALRDWYYPGDNYGREFPYPKQPIETAEVHTWAPGPAPAPAPARPAAAETPAPAAEPPAQVAEAAPSPAPEPEPQAAAEPQTVQEPTALPKTASPYPAIGVAGLLLFGLSGLMRWRRAMYLG